MEPTHSPDVRPGTLLAANVAGLTQAPAKARAAPAHPLVMLALYPLKERKRHLTQGSKGLDPIYTMLVMPTRLFADL